MSCGTETAGVTALVVARSVLALGKKSARAEGLCSEGGSYPALPKSLAVVLRLRWLEGPVGTGRDPGGCRFQLCQSLVLALVTLSSWLAIRDQFNVFLFWLVHGSFRGNPFSHAANCF